MLCLYLKNKLISYIIFRIRPTGSDKAVYIEKYSIRLNYYLIWFFF